MNIPGDLLPGDILLYSGYAIIRNITGSDVGHAECYIGNNQVITAEPEGGVGIFPLDAIDEIVHVVRPIGQFDLAAAMLGFNQYIGWGYGWSDDFSDINLNIGVEGGGKTMNCSHSAMLLLDLGGIKLFADWFSLRNISPADIMKVRGTLLLQ